MGAVVSFRRILPLLAMLALLIAPFGRMAAAEAMTMPHHAPETMASHCAGESQPDGDQGQPTAIDCLIACAAMAPAGDSSYQPLPVPAATHVALPVLAWTGIRHEADPPPPRFS